MQRQETATGQENPHPQHPETTNGDWAFTAYANTLDTQPTAIADIAYGVGSRYALGRHETGPQTVLELFAEQGVVRLSYLAEGVQVTLFHQETPPTVTPQGLVFELPTPTRWLSVGKDGSATLFVEPSADTAPSAAVAPPDRFP